MKHDPLSNKAAIFGDGSYIIERDVEDIAHDIIQLIKISLPLSMQTHNIINYILDNVRKKINNAEITL